MINIRNLSFKYNDDFVLQDINLRVRKGEFLGVLGTNGSGKSTLMRHLNAILRPTSGVVEVDGLDTSDSENWHKIRQKVGMVFQNPDNQFVANIVEHDVAFVLENLGLPSREIRVRIDEALKQVGMAEYAKKNPALLSGGQKQRVALAGALAHQPQALVLDEPLSMLDPVSRRELLALFRHLCTSMGITIIMVTQDADEILVADRVVVLEKGVIIQEGTPREVLKNGEYLRDIGIDVTCVVDLRIALGEMGKILGDTLFEDECCDKLLELLR